GTGCIRPSSNISTSLSSFCPSLQLGSFQESHLLKCIARPFWLAAAVWNWIAGRGALQTRSRSSRMGSP
uniref:Uncharacterized protein n=1 Tax=Varanus komodoensis TaxID=61221 RepID=A0A8D2L5S9_VARKO